jgi:hypothetical protein
MPKKLFASPEEEKEWRENRPAYLKAYHKKYKQKPEYAEWQKNYRSTPEFKKGHKKYMKRYNRKKSVKAKHRTPEAKERQNKNYLTRKDQGKIKYNPDYYKNPEVRERKNAARREKRQKKRAEREELLALMTPKRRAHFLNLEKKAKEKQAKGRKIRKAFDAIKAKEKEVKELQLEYKTTRERQLLERQQERAHRHAVDKAVKKVLRMYKSRQEKMQPVVLSMTVVSDRLTKYRNVIDEIREETEKAFGVMQVA